MVPGPSEHYGEIPPSSSRRQQPVGGDSAPPAPSRQCSPPPRALLLHPHRGASIPVSPSLHPPSLHSRAGSSHPWTPSPPGSQSGGEAEQGQCWPLTPSEVPCPPSQPSCSAGQGSALCPAVSFSWQCPQLSPQAEWGGSRWVSRASRQWAPGWHRAPGSPGHASTSGQHLGGGGDPHAVPASASPTAWQPLISPHQPRRWLRHEADGTNLPGSPCQGSHPRRAVAVPGRPCQASAQPLQMEGQAFPWAPPLRQPPCKYLLPGS